MFERSDAQSLGTNERGLGARDSQCLEMSSLVVIAACLIKRVSENGEGKQEQGWHQAQRSMYDEGRKGGNDCQRKERQRVVSEEGASRKVVM